MTNTPLRQATGTWTIDPQATTVEVSVQKLKSITVDGTLDVVEGTITVADDEVTSVKVSLDAGSYATKTKARDRVVVGRMFLDAARHPTITFEAPGSVTPDRIVGQITVKGRNSPLAFDVTDLEIDGDVAQISATATADRFDLGVGALPAFVIGGTLKVAVQATARRAH